MGSVRIYGGRYANRNITFLDTVSIRPTSSRARKVLFDWLRFSIKDKRCLDLFAGSGILAFEAMSQGAKSVLCIDHNQEVSQKIIQEAGRIGEAKLTSLRAKIPCELNEQFDLCFMDPPFDQKKLYQESMDWLKSIIVENGLLYVEAGECLGDISGWSLEKKKRVSSVWMHLYKKIGKISNQ